LGIFSLKKAEEVPNCDSSTLKPATEETTIVKRKRVSIQEPKEDISAADKQLMARARKLLMKTSSGTGSSVATQEKQSNLQVGERTTSGALATSSRPANYGGDPYLHPKQQAELDRLVAILFVAGLFVVLVLKDIFWNTPKEN